MANQHRPGHAALVIARLARRPQGCTNAEVQQATGMGYRDAGSRLGQMVRWGKLTKAPGRPVRYFAKGRE